MSDSQREVPLAATVGARGEAPRHSLYAEGITSKYVEGVRSVYAEGLKANSAYAEGIRRDPLNNESAKVALSIARAQVRSMSQMARLHHRLDRISDYLNKNK